MGHYSLQFGPQRHVSPESVAKLEDFVKFDSKATEDLWKATEDKLPIALAAAEAGTLLSSPGQVETIKDAIVLHYARSFDVLDSHQEIWQNGLDERRERALANPEFLEQVYFMKTGIRLPRTAATARELIADELIERTRALFTSGVAFRFRVVALYRKASDLVSAAGLQLLRPEGDSEFLIGDVPVITTDRSGHHQGISSGVPIGSAAAVFMPLGPKVGLALAGRDEDVPISAANVERLNTWEVQAARRGVFARAESPLIEWVATVRPPSGPGI